MPYLTLKAKTSKAKTSKTKTSKTVKEKYLFGKNVFSYKLNLKNQWSEAKSRGWVGRGWACRVSSLKIKKKK